MPLEYSSRAMIGYSELYSPFNEKSIFIEDEAGRLVHERIINRIVGEGRVKRVFPLNGREMVLADWRKNVSNSKNIYVIDGDLDLLYGKEISSDNLVSLDVYCIENYLFHSDTVSSVMEDYVKDHRTLEACIREAFADVLEHIDAIKNLYILYAVCHFHKCKVTTVKEGGLRFVEDQRVSRVLLWRRQRHFLKLIWAKIGRERYLEEKRFIHGILREHSDPTSFVSGKAFLFPVLHKILEKRYGYVGSVDLFVRQCSRYFQPDQAPKYAEFLLSHFPKSPS